MKVTPLINALACVEQDESQVSDENKIAIIVNADKAEHHIQNVENASRELKSLGYVVYVVSPEKPENADFYSENTSKKAVAKMVEQLKSNADDQTDLVIYTTGHGDQGANGPELCLGNGISSCSTSVLEDVLDIQGYGQRTVVMDQCFSGGLRNMFLDDPKTLFISTGSADRTVTCFEFSNRFWQGASEIAKTTNDQDGIINWRERFAYSTTDLSSIPQFFTSEGYVFEGEPSFPKTVLQHDDKTPTVLLSKNSKEEQAWIEDQLSQLQPGQFAFLYFSADWCGPCKLFAPVYEEKAAQANGEILFLKTRNDKLTELQTKYKVAKWPTVVLIDHKGQFVEVQDLSDINATFNLFGWNSSVKLSEYGKSILNEDSGVSRRAYDNYVLELQGIEDVTALQQEIARTKRAATEWDIVHSRYFAVLTLGSLIAKLPVKQAIDQSEDLFVLAEDGNKDIQAVAIDSLAEVVKATKNENLKNRLVQLCVRKLLTPNQQTLVVLRSAEALAANADLMSDAQKQKIAAILLSLSAADVKFDETSDALSKNSSEVAVLIWRTLSPFLGHFEPNERYFELLKSHIFRPRISVQKDEIRTQAINDFYVLLKNNNLEDDYVDEILKKVKQALDFHLKNEKKEIELNSKRGPVAQMGLAFESYPLEMFGLYSEITEYKLFNIAEGDLCLKGSLSDLELSIFFTETLKSTENDEMKKRVESKLAFWKLLSVVLQRQSNNQPIEAGHKILPIELVLRQSVIDFIRFSSLENHAIFSEFLGLVNDDALLADIFDKLYVQEGGKQLEHAQSHMLPRDCQEKMSPQIQVHYLEKLLSYSTPITQQNLNSFVLDLREILEDMAYSGDINAEEGISVLITFFVEMCLDQTQKDIVRKNSFETLAVFARIKDDELSPERKFIIINTAKKVIDQSKNDSGAPKANAEFLLREYHIVHKPE
ncbi:MAG: hypothetical protein H7A33_06030 [Deltaproteobacteria bacterium]|nr:hypothetical protein [Deltaproteobacteria bacterium]